MIALLCSDTCCCESHAKSCRNKVDIHTALHAFTYYKEMHSLQLGHDETAVERRPGFVVDPRRLRRRQCKGNNDIHNYCHCCLMKEFLWNHIGTMSKLVIEMYSNLTLVNLK